MKKTLLYVCVFVVTFLSFSQDERRIIQTIDELNIQSQKDYCDDKIDLAFQNLSKALILSDSIADTYGKISAYTTLEDIYLEVGDYENAITIAEQKLEASVSLKDNHIMAQAYADLGTAIKLSRGDSQKAIGLYNKALTYAESIKISDHEGYKEKPALLNTILVSLGELHINEKNKDKALAYLFRAKTNSDNITLKPEEKAKIYYALGQYHDFSDNTFNAIENYNLALELILNDTVDSFTKNNLAHNIYKDYASILSSMDEKDEAFNMLAVAGEYGDLVFNEKKIRQVNYAKSKFNIEEYKRNAEYANQQKRLQSQITEKTQRVNQLMIIVAIILSITLVVVIVSQLKYRKLAKKLKLQNDELEMAKDIAEHSSKQKSQFISNISHELRTPLYGVVGLTSLLMDSKNLDSDEKSFIKSLKFSGDYLLHLINDVLQFGKIESNKIELNSSSFKPEKLAKNIMNSFAYQLEGSKNKLHLDFDETIPQFLMGDTIRVSQVLINLIGNGLKFTKEGNVWLRLKQTKSSESTSTIRFVIEDDGPGIPKDKQQQIFEKFSQLDRNYNHEYQGTGLGLSITKNLLNIFGSEIELESEEDKGSKFSFEITFDIDTEKQEEFDVTNINQIVDLQEGRRILIAEDNKINQIVTKNILTKEGYQCHIVENGQMAIDAVKTEKFDLVLMDLNMPVMNGDEATVEIRKFDTEIPIVALTASVMEEVEEKLIASGMSDIIIKPYDNYDFFQIISKHLYQRYCPEAV
ncbi:ATP-binding protein [Winogradskyella sp. A3E31]|uniref:tetratricopeptide repeat-containing hybrid sensor histidine kinase/response regulator n=1 Tax=Winogradskyella sp. A3E31 TaxID=3349637 RepID=UPI00398BBA8E